MKLKDLPLKAMIWNKHKRTQKTLYFITWILFLPMVLLQIINDGLEVIVSKSAQLRTNIVYTTFKMIYKKEILESLEGVENGRIYNKI